MLFSSDAFLFAVLLILFLGCLNSAPYPVADLIVEKVTP